MNFLRKLQSATLVIAVLSLGFVALAVPQPTEAAKKRIKQLKTVEVGYTKKGKKVRIDWSTRKNAKRYKVRVYKGKTLVKEFQTKKNRQFMKLAKFADGKTYTVKVRAMKTKKKRASKWKTVKFKYYEPLQTAKTIDSTNVNGQMWFFAIPDEVQDGTVMFSSEQPGTGVRMARGRVDQADQLSWQDPIKASDLGVDNIADHWHIYAHGYHWISLSTSSATKSYLFKIDSNMNVVGSTIVADDVDITVPTGSTRLPTNDMFLVDEADGVTVGHFYPAYGSRLFRFDTELNLIETKDIGGGDYVHGNSSTALRTDDGFMLLAIDTINNVAHSKLQRMMFDEDWSPVSVKTLVNLPSTNISMPSGAFTEDGYLVVSARVDEDAYPEGVMPPPPENTPEPQGIQNQAVGAEDDSAAVWQFIFSPNKKNTLIKQTEFISEGANRPHTSIVDDQIVTIWDSTKGIRVQTIQ